jgi:hypothetical protein
MTWARLDDRLHAHPKAIKAGLEAMGVWVMALSYCAAYGTDGRVDRDAVERICGSRKVFERVTKRLEACGLWERDETGSGFRIHDFLDYNPSRSDVEKENENKRKGGIEGARRRWAGHRSADGITHDRTHGTRQPPANGGRDAPVPSRPDPERESPPTPRHKPPDRERPEPGRPTLAPTPRLIDPALKISAEQRANAEILGLQKIDGEWTKFVGHHRSRGTLSCDFGGEWDKWAVNARNYQATDRAREASRGPMTGSGPIGRQPDPPEAVEARQRARDHEHAKLRREAVPPPTSLASLIANVPGPTVRKASPPPSAPETRAELTDEELDARRRDQLERVAQIEGLTAKGSGES